MQKNDVPNIGNILSDTALRHGDRIGLTHGDESWTWAEIERGANALAAALLELGVTLGDRVAIQSQNSRAFFEAMYGIARTGGVYVPVNPRASVAETVQMVSRAGAKVFIVAPDHVEAARQVLDSMDAPPAVVVTDTQTLPMAVKGSWHLHVDLVARHRDAPTVSVTVDRDDICWQNFTSGTTGVPKGGMNSHGGLGFALMNRLAEVAPGLGPQDRFLALAWIGHGTGTMTAASVLAGCPVVIPASTSFDPGLCWDIIERHGITATFTVPTILMRLLRHERARSADLTRLAHIIVTGAAITAADLELATDMLGDALVQYFGAVEAVGAGTVIRPNRFAKDDPARYSIGFPRLGCEVLIADDAFRPLPAGEAGEICLRGAGVFRGFHNDPASTAAVFRDGWYLSGDLGYRDASGMIFLAGRKKEMFKSGGLQVYPLEIQNHLANHPGVEEAHLIAVPDSDLGEIGVAVVKLKPGAAVSEAELQDLLNGKLSRYKLPRRIFIVDELPRNANGKVPRALLVEALAAQGLIVPGEDVARLSSGRRTA